MYPDDVLQTAWSVTARHLSKGQEDPVLMVAEGIMQERQRWLIETVNTVVRQVAQQNANSTDGV
ncbi:hypothetical protein [Rhizobium sp. Root482]|uniref:hypothetical protein n=1 Tax=Rhizobium sp. Root482 TaxID=1736543 RepID=UPI000A580902|nr:hypothetical protein [Rhizobium sp. Root482]